MTALMKAVQNNHSNDVALIFQRFPSPISNTLDVQDKVNIFLFLLYLFFIAFCYCIDVCCKEKILSNCHSIIDNATTN